MKITVVICTYNGEKYLLKTLTSLKNQTLHKSEYEILIVDNNSTNKVPTISKNFVAENKNLNCNYVIEPNKGLSSARNCGIKNAKGNLIVFIDDDAIADENFLKAHVNLFEGDEKISAAGGKVLPIYPNNKAPKWLSKLIWGIFSLVDLGEKEKVFSPKFPVGCNMAFRKSLFDELGMFDEKIKYRSDDKFIFLKIKEKNKLVYYNPKAIANHIIDKDRQSDESFKKVSYLTGAGERERFKGNILLQTKTIVELVLKLFASILIGFIHLIKGELPKAKYIIWNRILVIEGFFKYKN